MKNPDVDDIFNDFEHKVTDKKETFKKPQPEMSEEELLKRKYQEEKEALKEKHKEDTRALEEKRQKQLLKEGKAPQSFAPTEKIAYIGVIVVLILYIGIDFSFYHGEKSTIEDYAITASVVEEVNESVEAQEEVKEAEEVVVEEEKPVEEEEELSGVITLTIDKIDTEVKDEDVDMGYINKIVFTIDNGKDKVLIPTVDVFAYDSEIDESWEIRSRGQYTFKAGIPSGKKHSGSISLSPKTFRNLDLKKDIRLTLNDTEDGFITAVNDKVTIS